MKNKINIALIGFGNVASGLCRLLATNKNIIGERINCNLNITKSLVKNLSKKRIDLPNACQLVTSLDSIIDDENVDIVVELCGDTKLSFEAMQKSLLNNKAFVTANKSMIAEKSKVVWPLFKKYSDKIGFEACVGGSLPIMRVLRESYCADQIQTIAAITNGTTNYILSQMTKYQVSINKALESAKLKGYSEPEPSLDINGIDSAHKINITATLAFHRCFSFDQIKVKGITDIKIKDIIYAKKLGYSIKLLGITKKIDEKFSIVVEPTMVKNSSILAPVSGVNNAFLIRGQFLGDSLIYGPGAGADTTAVAVAADIIEIIRNISLRNNSLFKSKDIDKNYAMQPYSFNHENILDYELLVSMHYIRLSVLDKVGVLTTTSNLFSNENVSILQIYQNSSEFNDQNNNNNNNNIQFVDLVIITHLASNGAIHKIISNLKKQSFVLKKPQHIHINNSL